MENVERTKKKMKKCEPQRRYWVAFNITIYTPEKRQHTKKESKEKEINTDKRKVQKKTSDSLPYIFIIT